MALDPDSAGGNDDGGITRVLDHPFCNKSSLQSPKLKFEEMKKVFIFHFSFKLSASARLDYTAERELNIKSAF